MPVDGSATGNIERQSLGDPLPDRTTALKKHGSNIVDRSFRGNVTPVGTPENILSALMEAAGSVGNLSGQIMAQKVDEDKTKQASNFYNGMAPDDDATTAGYRAHAVLKMNNKALTSTARLKQEAETFAGTDPEWSAHVAASQTADHNALMEEYPALKNDPLTGKALVAMYGEQLPSISAARMGFKLAQEHEARLDTLGASLRVRAAGLKPEEQYKIYDGAMDSATTLGLTKKDAEKSLSLHVLSQTEEGDLSGIEYTKIVREGQKTSLFDRSPALQKAEVAGKKVYWSKHQDQIAGDKMFLQESLDKGELTKDEFITLAQGLNDKYSNLAYTDDSMIAGASKTKKDTPWLNQTEYANSIGATTDELNAGKFKGNRAGFFTRAGQDNTKHGAMVWTDNAMAAAWEKHEQAVASATDVNKYGNEFFATDKSNRTPLGQRGFDTKTSDSILAGAKIVIANITASEVAKLPANHSAADEAAIRQRGQATYIKHLSAERLKDPEFVRVLSSLKYTDMSDSKNMKNLNPGVEEAIALYNSMDEGARDLHMEKADRNIYDNFNSYLGQGGRVSAMEKAIFAHRNPRVLTGEFTKELNKLSDEASTKAIKGWKTMIPFGLYDNTPSWYKGIHSEEMRASALRQAMGGIVDAKTAVANAHAEFASTHTQLSNGTHVLGTLPVLAERMKVVPEDVPKYFQTYLEMNKEDLSDAGNVPITDMYFVTNPERGTFQVKTRSGDLLGLPAPLSELKRGAGAFLENQKTNILDKMKKLKDFDPQISALLSSKTLAQSETHVEDQYNLSKTLVEVEGSGSSAGFDERAGAYKPVRDINGKQWNIGHGIRISDTEYSQDYIVRDGRRLNLGRIKPSMITPTVALDLVQREIDVAKTSLRKVWSDFDALPAKYQGVLVSLHYNTVGIKKGEWPKLKEAMDDRDDAAVKREMVTHYHKKGSDKITLQNRADTIYKRLFK